MLHIYPSATERRQTLLLNNPLNFNCDDYFVFGEICTGLGVSSGPMFLWISSFAFSLNLLLARSHQAEIIIVNRPIQGRNYATTWVRVEPRSRLCLFGYAAAALYRVSIKSVCTLKNL